ncbi:hypothetical protein [Flavobacterium sp.]|uniref:hypothetical protein n=1 Tax=Flavobacterium sp. TaxID=239 RepID=UPI002EDA7896
MTTNTPNKNAALDLNNTNGTNTKGLLLPKVALTATDSALPMSTHTAGMKVYNTATAGTGINAVTPGEYCNDGTQWVRTPSTAWYPEGNDNINPVNFVGTTDAVDFVTRTNNTERMRVTSGGQVLVGTTTVPTGGTTSKMIINNGTTAGAVLAVEPVPAVAVLYTCIPAICPDKGAAKTVLVKATFGNSKPFTLLPSVLSSCDNSLVAISKILGLISGIYILFQASTL